MIIEGICVSSKEIQRKQILIDEKSGLIKKVLLPENFSSSPDYNFSDDCLIFAGMGDVHIHAREDVSQKNCYKEDYQSAFMAMKGGGLAHAGDMPNNPIPPVDNESYQEKFKLAAKCDHHIWPYAGIGPKTRPLSYPVPYKVYMGPSIGELYFKDFEELKEALAFYQGESVSFHCEDPLILENHKQEQTHFKRRPLKAEAVATRDALHLIELFKLKGKLCHYSCDEGLDLIREARARGVDVEIEVTPQHLFFSEETIPKEREIFFQMNPPIRGEIQRLKLFSAFLGGEINYLATDHAPHTKEEKEKGISGLTGLDTFGAFVTWLIHEGCDPRIVAKAASENPGRFHQRFLTTWKNLSPKISEFGKGFGFLEEEYSASLTVLNLKNPIKVTSSLLKTRPKHSPFEGVELPGRLEALFLKGKIV